MSNEQNNNSYFDGGLLGLAMRKLFVAFVTTITFGLAYPWAICSMKRWECAHTVINGHRLKFTGTGAQLFGNWIKWFLLTIFTLGIYSFWMGIAMKKWEVKHTVFAD